VISEGVMYGKPDPGISESTPERVLTMIWTKARPREAEQPRTLLSTYVDRTHAEYFAKESYVDDVSGAVEPYTSIVVATNVILASKDDIDVVFAAFTRQTAVRPCEIDIDPESKTWSEWELQISVSILHRELLRRYPEVARTDRVRNNKYDHD
jgi:hypothetical protein